MYAILNDGHRDDTGLKGWLGVNFKWLPVQSTDVFYGLNTCDSAQIVHRTQAVLKSSSCLW